MDAGKAVNLIGRYVVSLALGKLGQGYLIRWPADDVARGRLDRAHWWAGCRGWLTAATLHEPPIGLSDGRGCRDRRACVLGRSDGRA